MIMNGEQVEMRKETVAIYLMYYWYSPGNSQNSRHPHRDSNQILAE
jgi:hypothetical protein